MSINQELAKELTDEFLFPNIEDDVDDLYNEDGNDETFDEKIESLSSEMGKVDAIDTAVVYDPESVKAEPAEMPKEEVTDEAIEEALEEARGELVEEKSTSTKENIQNAIMQSQATDNTGLMSEEKDEKVQEKLEEKTEETDNNSMEDGFDFEDDLEFILGDDSKPIINEKPESVETKEDEVVEEIKTETIAETVKEEAPVEVKEEETVEVQGQVEEIDSDDVEDVLVEPKDPEVEGFNEEEHDEKVEKLLDADRLNKVKFVSRSFNWNLESPSQKFNSFYVKKADILSNLLDGGEIDFASYNRELVESTVDVSVRTYDPKEVLMKMQHVQALSDRVKEIQVQINSQYFYWDKAIEMMEGVLAGVEYLKPAIRQQGLVYQHLDDFVQYHAKLKALHASCDIVTKRLENAFFCLSRQVTIAMPNRNIERYQGPSGNDTQDFTPTKKVENKADESVVSASKKPYNAVLTNKVEVSDDLSEYDSPTGVKAPAEKKKGVKTGWDHVPSKNVK